MKIIIKNAIPILFMFVFIFQNCSSSKKVASKNNTSNEMLVSYETEIKPIMVVKCTPCHFPKNGRKKMLHNYVATSNNIKDILYRVQLPHNDNQYMPFKEKRESLTENEIDLMKTWVDQGMSK